MRKSIKQRLEEKPIVTSAPCRIDMGGTLDISTFYYPLMHLSPCTFNMAMNLRTKVTILPYSNGVVKISSGGFESAEYRLGEAPFNHPLGLMFAITAYFRVAGIHIVIDSASPPRSALGGSSVAGVALIGALSKLCKPSKHIPSKKKDIAILAQQIESLVAQSPCGSQDQLAAVYGGVNAYYWQPGFQGLSFIKKTVVKKERYKELEKCVLSAYCGLPHESLDTNGKWIRQFMGGKYRKNWEEIVQCTHEFIRSMRVNDIKSACRWMNKETSIRQEMTPQVLDHFGENLVGSAINTNCGARFTGAGGGGCLWAIGTKKNIQKLKEKWKKILSQRENACLLNTKIDSKGLLYH